MPMPGDPIVPTSVYTVMWAGWVAWFAFWETLALFDPGVDDTFTEHLRPLIHSTRVGWLLGGLFVLWLGYHFLLEGR